MEVRVMKLRLTILSALLASPLLVFGGQSTGVPTANQPAVNQTTASQFTVSQTIVENSHQISCVGNEGGHYTVTVPDTAFSESTPQDQAFVSEEDQRPLHSSGCG